MAKISHLLKKLELVFTLQVRTYSVAPKFKLLNNIEELIEKEKIKPRRHPGVNANKITQLPEWLDQAIRQSVEDANKNQVLLEHQKFANYLFSRRLPAEKNDIKEKYYEIKNKLVENKLDNLTEEEANQVNQKLNSKVKKKLKQSIFNWKPLDYHGYRTALYMVTRCVAEYAALTSIFKEINKRDPEFKPRTVFDFGSGVGTVLWAATQYWKNIEEYVGIDISNDMNDLAEEIFSYSPTKVKGIYHKQYLPVSNLKFEVVVSAYTLMDLSDARCRLEVLSKLWRKTDKYLVIVEQGTLAGFTLINEAREFVKYMSKNSEPKLECVIFAPCPHDSACPRFAENNTPCNFLSQYKSLSLFGPPKATNELYSYVVLKKGTRTENDNWYRIVRPTIARSRHARCQLCTADGKLQEVVFTAAKYGKSLYRCAKVTKWGDRLPIRPTKGPLEDENVVSELEASNDDFKEDEENFEEKTQAKEKEKFMICSEAPIVVNKHDS
ncbi:methyltransferase-like protein 17, mitochondrial [Phymastichus coffea]|uniref:methyltransferase-like protein 17, mitochondrial n=1 Tax=Phymastichus coffea TaxID=108790 RepID=UPI00273B93E5|nr:methyltransferase-like protein 17, mitochondrial [Phymastichus coffea]XP_058793381.1 methyltransferase-like protein 17, mitochondrial [Phymastichus coffea]XP_058793382.1 methyltransferase-like protein 17, mitochondrial [Phymastichus coffea]